MCAAADQRQVFVHGRESPCGASTGRDCRSTPRSGTDRRALREYIRGRSDPPVPRVDPEQPPRPLESDNPLREGKPFNPQGRFGRYAWIAVGARSRPAIDDSRARPHASITFRPPSLHSFGAACRRFRAIPVTPGAVGRSPCRFRGRHFAAGPRNRTVPLGLHLPLGRPRRPYCRSIRTHVPLRRRTGHTVRGVPQNGRKRPVPRHPQVRLSFRTIVGRHGTDRRCPGRFQPAPRSERSSDPRMVLGAQGSPGTCRAFPLTLSPDLDFAVLNSVPPNGRETATRRTTCVRALDDQRHRSARPGAGPCHRAVRDAVLPFAGPLVEPQAGPMVTVPRVPEDRLFDARSGRDGEHPPGGLPGRNSGVG